MLQGGRRPPLGRRSCAERLAVIRHGPAAEQRQYGEHAPVVVLAVGEPQPLEDGLDMPFDRAGAEVELLGDRSIGSALCKQGKHRAFAVGELFQGRSSAAPDEAFHDLWIEGGAARGDAFHGVDELADVAHTVLEQVAHPGRVVADQFEHVGGLEVLGEHENGYAGMRAPDLDGRDQPVVGVAWRHPHIDDCDVRTQ